MSRLPTVAAIRTRLLDAEPAIVSWIESDTTGHRDFSLRTKIESAREQATSERETGWSVDQAVAWMLESTGQLIGDTHFEGMRMAKDDYGASGSTYEPLKNYAVIGADAPLAIHADALELLRVHSNSQLSRADFEAAHEAIHRALAEAGETPPEEGRRPYIPDVKKAENLRGGGRYELTPTELLVETGPSRAVAAMLREKLRGKARYRDPGNRDFRIVVHPEHIAEVGREFEKLGFSELGRTLEYLAPVWEKKLGATRAPPAPVAPAAPPSGDADKGAVPAERTRWAWDKANYQIRLYTPYKAIDVVKRIGNGTVIGRDNEATRYEDTYFVAIPTRAEILDLVLPKLAETFPLTATAMRPFVPTWTAERSALKQSREGGRTEEGAWELHTRQRRTTKGIVTDEVVRIYTLFLRDPETGEAVRWWGKVPGAKGGKHDGRRFSVEVPVRRMGKTLEALRRHYPRLAEAMSRAFGGVAGAVDEEVEACEGRVDLHDKLKPEDATNPDAIEAVAAVRDAFRTRVPAGLSPLPFQIVGIAFAKLTDYRALIGDAPGLGKTIQGLGCLITDPEMLLPAVIVAPKNVTMNWMDEAAKWMPTVPRKFIESQADEIPSRGWKGICVMSWEMLVAHQQEIIDAGTACVIADEAHYAKNPAALRTKALVEVLDQVPHGILLTGTPIKNVVVELHTLLAALDKETWGTRKAFADAYVEEQKKVQGGGVKYIGVKDVDPLQTRLACAMVRRKKEDALKDLPAKKRVYFQVDLTPEQRAEYKRAEESFDAWYAERSAQVIREQLLKQGIDPAKASAEARKAAAEKVDRMLQAEAIVKMGEQRRIVGRAKIPAAIDLTKRLVSEGENVVIFAAHKEVIDGITRALNQARIPFGVIDGNASAQARGQATRDFQAGTLRVIVASEAGKEGLTLTRAANTIFIERYWTPADEQQAEDRIHRIGQKRAVVITYLHVPETIDDRMDEIIQAKRALVDKVIGDDTIEDEDRAETQAEFVRFLVSGRRGPPPPDLQPLRVAAETLTRAVRENPGPKIETVRRGDVQALLFDRRAWTPKTAAHWAKVNGYTVGPIAETRHYLNVEQKHADRFDRGSFRTINLSSSVRAIVGRSR